MLKKAREDRIAALGRTGSWPEIIVDLDSLTETEIGHEGKRFVVCAAPRLAASSLASRAAAVALPPTVRAAADSCPPQSEMQRQAEDARLDSCCHSATGLADVRVCGHGSNCFLRPKIAGGCWPIVADRNRPLKHVRRAHVVLCSADRLACAGSGARRERWPPRTGTCAARASDQEVIDLEGVGRAADQTHRHEESEGRDRAQDRRHPPLHLGRRNGVRMGPTEGGLMSLN